mmetsp:Transcript_78317/g.207881  ORF Transcript_78317/g.207881 Transcript_78317/m.207881 type:complete len:296 (+) Transcript_78317:1121-2008(+)
MLPAKVLCILYSMHCVTNAVGWSKASMWGLYCLRWMLGVMMLHSAHAKVLQKAMMPEGSFWFPRELFKEVSAKGSLTSSVRCARTREPTSMASARKPPAPKHSTWSTSKTEMLALRMASEMASCSAGPLGAVRLAPLPLLFMVDPASKPILFSSSVGTNSSFTCSTPSFNATEAQPSPRTKPAAVALKVKQRPSTDREPMAHQLGQLLAARQMLAPIAVAQSLLEARPFFSRESAERCMAVLPEEASVSKVILGPFKPKQKEKRPELILSAAPVAPKAPESSFGTWFHSVFPHPT